MKYKIGDRVKFLDQKGGGIVTKIISSQVVQVQDENGFEIPTLVKDLVKIDEENTPSAGKMFIEPTSDKTPAITEVYKEESTNNNDLISPLKAGYNADKMQSGIYLAFVPHEQQWLLMGDIDVYILNHTQYHAFYSLFLQTETGYDGIDYNMIPPESKSYIQTIERDDINNWLKGVAQILFHEDHLQKIFSPISSEFKINGEKFYKESSFSYIPIMKDKILLVEIEKID